MPDHTTLSRRGQTVRVRLARRGTGRLHAVVDSSGLKGYGDGEWTVKQHGYSKRRTGHKIHLAVDADAGEIEAALLTEASVHDAEAAPLLLTQLDRPLASVAGDGAYDRQNVVHFECGGDGKTAFAREKQIRASPRRKGNSNLGDCFARITRSQ